MRSKPGNNDPVNVEYLLKMLPSVSIDDHLSETSENPVQNKVIALALKNIINKILEETMNLDCLMFDPNDATQIRNGEFEIDEDCLVVPMFSNYVVNYYQSRPLPELYSYTVNESVIASYCLIEPCSFYREDTTPTSQSILLKPKRVVISKGKYHTNSSTNISIVPLSKCWLPSVKTK